MYSSELMENLSVLLPPAQFGTGDDEDGVAAVATVVGLAYCPNVVSSLQLHVLVNPYASFSSSSFPASVIKEW